MALRRPRRELDVAGTGAITLQIKPHVGDTLRMRLDQQSEKWTSVRRTKVGESSAMVMNSMKMFSRAIVEGAADKVTTLLAVTDSVILATSDEHARAAARAGRGADARAAACDFASLAGRNGRE